MRVVQMGSICGCEVGVIEHDAQSYQCVVTDERTNAPIDFSYFKSVDDAISWGEGVVTMYLLDN